MPAGRPPPRVVWLGNGRPLDTVMESQVMDDTSEDADYSEGSSLATPRSASPASHSSPRPHKETEASSTVPAPSTALRSWPARGGATAPYNTLTLGPLTREHLHMRLTCQAVNSNLTRPAALTLTLDMNREYLCVPSATQS